MVSKKKKKVYRFYPRVEGIMLTPSQEEALEPLRLALIGGDGLGAILGQAYLLPNSVGAKELTMMFSYLNLDQYIIVNKAIGEASKLSRKRAKRKVIRL